MRDGIGSASDLGVEGAGRGNTANGFRETTSQGFIRNETRRNASRARPEDRADIPSHPTRTPFMIARYRAVSLHLDEAIKLRSRAQLNADRRLTGDPFLFKLSELTSRAPTSLNLEQRT